MNLEAEFFGSRIMGLAWCWDPGSQRFVVALNDNLSPQKGYWV